MVRTSPNIQPTSTAATRGREKSGKAKSATKAPVKPKRKSTGKSTPPASSPPPRRRAEAVVPALAEIRDDDPRDQRERPEVNSVSHWQAILQAETAALAALAQEMKGAGESPPPLDVSHLKKRTQRVFLQAIAVCPIIAKAAAAANIHRTTHFVWMNSDEQYKEAFEAAHAIGVERLEAIAHQRATQGWLEPVYHQGFLVGAVRKFSDGLLQQLLKANLPEKYRERSSVDHSGALHVLRVKRGEN